MRVTQLQTKSFKGLPDELYEFGDKTKISGHNGSGKSSIAEAISFALYGKSKSGSRETDKLIKNDDESCTVAVVFDTGTTIVRTQSRFYGSTILLNDEKVDQQTLDASLPDFKIFASVFFVGNFFNYSEDEQRQLLLGLSPDIDMKQLFISFVRDENLLKKWPIDFSNLEAENKTFKKRLSDLKALQEKNLHQIEFTETEIKNIKKPKLIDTDKIEKKLDKAEKIEKQWAEYDLLEEQYQIAVSRSKREKPTHCQTCKQKLPAEAEIALPDRPKEPKAERVSSREINFELSEAKANNFLIENFEEEILDKRSKISKLETELEEIAENIADLELITGALGPKGIRASEMRSKTESLLKPLKELIPNIDIQTLIPLKTKEGFKEVFKLTVKGVEYKFLSTGEKKRVDIAIAILINDLTESGVNMFFLDDAELLDIEDPLSEGQVFYAYVKNEDLKFKSL